MRIHNLIFFVLLLFLNQGCLAQYVPPKVEISTEKVNVKGELFYLHKVEKKQTLFSIARSYGVSSEAIIKDNPSITSGLKEGQVIYIKVAGSNPATSRQKEEVLPQEKPAQIQAEHIVRWYETLSSIAKKYGVSEQEIVESNKLQGNRIEVRQKLLIPHSGQSTPLNVIQDGIISETEKKVINSKEKEADSTPEVFPVKSYFYPKIKAKLLLPLQASRALQEESEPSVTNNFIEFYQGFLLALNDIKESNPDIKLEIEVIDTEQSSVESIISSGRLDNADILFGPVYREELESIVQYASRKGIYVVSPMDPGSGYLAKSYDRFFQVSTPVTYQQRGILSALNFMSDVTLIYEEIENGTDEIAGVTMDILNSANIRYKQVSYNILKGRSILPSIEARLTKGAVNHVVVASNSEAFVSDVLRNLNLLKTRSNYEITVYGTPRWRSYESVDINYYHQMNLNIYMQYYLDYNRENIKEFLSKYRALFLSEPSPYAFQAYDIAAYFLVNMWDNGSAFLENASVYKKEMLQSDYNFIRESDGDGFVNTAVRRVIYRSDYSTADFRGFFQ
jgi:LysM repeat protein